MTIKSPFVSTAAIHRPQSGTPCLTWTRRFTAYSDAGPYWVFSSTVMRCRTRPLSGFDFRYPAHRKRWAAIGDHAESQTLCKQSTQNTSPPPTPADRASRRPASGDRSRSRTPMSYRVTKSTGKRSGSLCPASAPKIWRPTGHRCRPILGTVLLRPAVFPMEHAPMSSSVEPVRLNESKHEH